MLSVPVVSQNINREIDSLFEEVINLEKRSPLKSQAEVRNILALAKRHRYKLGVLKAELFLSESYIRTKEDQLALYYANSVDKKISDEDVNLKVEALRFKGISLGRLGFIEDGSRLLHKAIIYVGKSKVIEDRNKQLGFIYANIALNYQENEIYGDSIGYYFQKSFSVFNAMEDNNIHKNSCMAFAFVNLGTFNLKKQNYEVAKAYFEKGLKLSEELKLDYISIEALSGIGSVEYFMGDTEQAEIHFHDALDLAKFTESIFYINDLYYNLAQTYKVLNKKDLSVYYKEKYIQLNDSLSQSHQSSIDNSLRLFLYEKDKKTSSIVEITIAGIVLSSIIITVVFTYMRMYKRRLRNIQVEAKLVNEQLEKKQELIKKFTIQNNSLKNQIDQGIRILEEGNPSFFLKFKEIHGDYIARLTELAPDILLSELRFCALIKLGLTTSEIAAYTKSTIRSVESRRYRLRKKFNIPADKDLSDWLLGI